MELVNSKKKGYMYKLKVVDVILQRFSEPRKRIQEELIFCIGTLDAKKWIMCFAGTMKLPRWK